MQNIMRIILALELLEAIKRFSTESSAHAFDWLIGLHIVDVSTAAERPRLDSSCGLPGPVNLFRIEGGILPDCQSADIERGMAEANRAGRCVIILRSTVQRFDHNPPRWTTQRDKIFEQFIEQFVWKFTDKVTLPVVAIFAICGIDHTLLIKKCLWAHAIFDEPGA